MGRGLLGMTIACARCHDHKFDPIPTRDYYALAGILRSTHVLIHENVSKWPVRPIPMSAEERAVWDADKAKAKAARKAKRDAQKAASASDSE